jgi:hypothetical protein
VTILRIPVSTHNMFKLNSLDLDPPGGWRWHCDVHDLTLRASTFTDLLFKVNSYLRANGIVVDGDRVAWLQDAMCRQHGWGKETCTEV